MSLCMNQCLKRFPLVSFSRYASTAAASRASKSVAPDTNPNSSTVDVPEIVKGKKRSPRKPKSPPPQPHALGKSKLQEHLNDLAETNGKVVLADIERCRPASHTTPGTPAYEEEYNSLFKKISDSFNVKQLRSFAKMYGISLPSVRQKQEFVVAIMEEWNWPSLTTIREKQKEVEPGVETIPLTPTAAFLILGKDGVDSHSLSNKYHVRMTYLTNPLALRIEGPIGSIKIIKAHIADLNANIMEDVFELPVDKPIRSDLLHRISRLSGALTQSFGENKACILLFRALREVDFFVEVRVAFNGNNARTASVAKRLAARAVCEETHSEQKHLYFHLPPTAPTPDPAVASTSFPHDYALYPFLSPRSLPWTVNAGGVFRVRRVEDSLSTGAENLKKTGGLLMGRGRMINLQRQEMDLRTLLLAGYSESPFSSRMISASIGHILVTSPPGPVSIAPPLALQGQWKLPYFLGWMEKQSEPTVFSPTLPAGLLESQPVQPKMLHRLIYHAVNTENDVAAARKIIRVELVLPHSIKENFELGARESISSTCWVGRKVELDVMMPDRPADIQFSFFDSTILADDLWPASLAEYISNLRSFLLYQDRDASQPETPLTVTHEGTTYVLHSSSTVRQNMESVVESETIRILTESTVDLEGDQKSTSCEVICDDIVSEASWKMFLQQCDSLSTTPTTKQSTHAAPQL
ncbi:hypothetical protein MSAN_02151900 [Mycena sanguinolenta]|uniref:SLS1 N-terminal domain-containing protein n=1 Tax=Mycena sanguinolenta TaxID=230812 RepID=A0A8H6XFE6_9AGAR|nr:hypothetical protein MSAN_02151900 [Mycena sanguinolenta]